VLLTITPIRHVGGGILARTTQNAGKYSGNGTKVFVCLRGKHPRDVVADVGTHGREGVAIHAGKKSSYKLPQGYVRQQCHQHWLRGQTLKSTGLAGIARSVSGNGDL